MTSTGVLCVHEYAADVHGYLRAKECRRFVFREQSAQLHLRTDILAMLDKVCAQLGFCRSVQHLAVYLLDIFMDNHTIHSYYLPLVAIGCLLVAVKVDERDNLIPKNSELNALLGNKYKLVNFVEMETAILDFYRWDILFPTAVSFTEYYALHAVQGSDLTDERVAGNYEDICAYVRKYIDYFLDVTLQDYTFVNFNPSLVSAAIIAATRYWMGLSPAWPTQLQELTRYKHSHLKQCIDLLNSALHRDSHVAQNRANSKSSTNAKFCEDNTPTEMKTSP